MWLILSGDWKVVKMGRFWPKSKAYTWYFDQFSSKFNVTQNQSHWILVKIGRFWPKSKAIHLVFCPIFTKIQCDWFWVEIEKWWKWADFDQKVRLYTWYFAQFSPLFNLHSKSVTLNFGENWSKYQVYSTWFLVFKNSVTDFDQIEKWSKWADFDQKVRLYTWYFAHFHENSMWLILSGDWKVVKMGRFWPKSKAIHLVFWPIFNLHSMWILSQIEKWWKWADFDQKVRLYTWYFAQFSPKFNVTDFEWRLKSGENGQILTKK